MPARIPDPTVRPRTVNLVCSGAFLQALRALAAADGQPLGRWIEANLRQAHGDEIARLEARLKAASSETQPR